MTALARKLGTFDATMIVMGGIIGSGIFINPSVVAQSLHSAPLILGAWIAGGCVALSGAFIYAELSALRPEAGGQYAYLRDAFHPSLAFLYGWALLLVIQSGGMAAVAVTFARYARELTHSHAPDWLIAVTTLTLLTFINCLGVRSGSNTQNVLMILKLMAIAMLLGAGFFFVETSRLSFTPVLDAPASMNVFTRFAAAMTPIMFAYGGWQTSSFISGELKRPGRDLVAGLLAGVAGVVIIYVAVNLVCLRALGPDGLAATRTPASAVMRMVMGEQGAILIALGIAISTLGFLSQGMLTAPRVYYAMAEDGLFFRSVARVNSKTRAPAVAIALQGVVAIAITVSGTYEQILSYVVATDFIFFGLVGIALFLFRRREEGGSEDRFRAPGHPVTTLLFTLSCWIIVIAAVIQSPVNSAIGFVILLAGLPAYAFWKRGDTSPRELPPDGGG